MADARDHYLQAETLVNEYYEATRTTLDEAQVDDLALKLQAANVEAQLATADLLRQVINAQTN